MLLPCVVNVEVFPATDVESEVKELAEAVMSASAAVTRVSKPFIAVALPVELVVSPVTEVLRLVISLA